MCDSTCTTCCSSHLYGAPPDEWEFLDADVRRPPLLKGLHDLPALPLRGRQPLRHPADLPDSPGSDSSRGAPHQAVFSVGRSEGGGGWVVS